MGRLGPGRRRAAIRHVMRVLDISERLACRLVGLARSSFSLPRNGDSIADPDQALRAWLRAYTRKDTRWGYRRA